jgi:hypothetical protein
VKKGLQISISADRRSTKIVALTASWAERSAHFQKLLPYLAAHYVKHSILEHVSKEEEWAPYRASLDIAKVVGGPKGLTVYALRSNPRHRHIRRIEAPKTVLYVRAKRQLRRVKAEISILERFNPWTLQTIPFLPSRAHCVLISRRVSKGEVERVTKARVKDRPRWRRALDRTGHREVKKDRRLKLPKKVHTVPDVAFEALRLEFGLGGVKGKPHWRPSIRRLISTGFKSMLRRDPHLKQTFTHAGFRGWKHWPPPTRHKIRMAEARNYLPFQRKLGIRI